MISRRSFLKLSTLLPFLKPDELSTVGDMIKTDDREWIVVTAVGFFKPAGSDKIYNLPSPDVTVWIDTPLRGQWGFPPSGEICYSGSYSDKWAEVQDD
jgi:hypothetical protein